MDEHKDHDTATAAAEQTETQKQLEQAQRRFQQQIQETEKELQELIKAVETLKSFAQTAVEDSERIFTEMIRSIERRRSEVTELIRAQEKAEVSRAEEHLKQLEQEIAELKRRDAELEQLSHTDDNFLKKVTSIKDSSRIPRITFSQSFSFETMKESVSLMKAQLNDIIKKQGPKISAAVKHVQIIRSSQCTDPELPIRRTSSNEGLKPNKIREELLQYSCHFTLDPNTAYRELHLSEGNRRGDCRFGLSYPDHSERFDKWCQVLCREGVSGRCYWEVEWSLWASIAVSYKSISRKGGSIASGFGYNDQSWSLNLTCGSCSFMHSNQVTKLSRVRCPKIGVYVDHSAGTLAFYSISDKVTLLHRVQATFTDTLYPGFRMVSGASLKLL